METAITDIRMDGVSWGEMEKVPMLKGFTMLKVNCTINDSAITLEDVEDEVSKLENLVDMVEHTHEDEYEVHDEQQIIEQHDYTFCERKALYTRNNDY